LRINPSHLKYPFIVLFGCVTDVWWDKDRALLINEPGVV